MSYDMNAFKLPPGEDPATYEPDFDDTPPTPEQRATMERLAAAIAAVDAEAERHDDETFIEFAAADAIQVSLYCDQAAISVPYWYEGDQAEAVMARMQAYAAVLTEVGGYTVWDPQTEEIVTGPGARDVYSAGVDAVKQLAEDPPKRRRWWQRRP